MATVRGRTVSTLGGFLMPVGLSGSQPRALFQVIISDQVVTALALTDRAVTDVALSDTEVTKLTISDEPQ